MAYSDAWPFERPDKEEKHMPRYIIIDRNSGYIWGDSADINGRIITGTPCEVAEVLDESIGERGYEYAETSLHDPSATYDVYRADIGGSEQVGCIDDGQDQEMIDAVQSCCQFVTSISRRRLNHPSC